MNAWAFLLVGLIVGSTIGWLLSKSRAAAAEATASGLGQQNSELAMEVEGLRGRLEIELRDKATAQASLEAERKNLEQQRKLLDEAAAKLGDTFKALSSDVLGSQSEMFLNRARDAFDRLRAEAEGDLDKRKEAVENLVKPLQEVLEKYGSRVGEIEASRKEAYGALREQLAQLGQAQSLLQRETANLVTALRKPQVRGRWGEVTLRRLAELSGMVDHCDFFEQQTFSSEEGAVRPDMVVHLPGDREIVVDSKVALDAYMDAIEAPSDELKEQFLARHAAQVRRHVEQLSSRAYWDHLGMTPEFVVLFLPGEPFLGAAVERDPKLIEDGWANKVAIATPNTLITLLLSVYHGWRQEKIAKDVQIVNDLGKQLYKRVSTMWEHLDSLRGAIDKAVEAWNRVVGSLEHQVLPSVRKFRELEVTTAEEIPELGQVETTTRGLPPPLPEK